MKKTTMPDWCVAVKKAMIDHDDMTVTELAKETGFSRSHIGTTQAQKRSSVRVLRGENAGSQYPLLGQKAVGRKDIPLEQAAGRWGLDSPLSGVFRFQQSSGRTGISWPGDMVDERDDRQAVETQLE